MFRLLFSWHGRIGRASFWLGHLLLVALAVGGVILIAAIAALGSAGHQASDGPGAAGIAALIVAILIMACGSLALVASGICLGIRRYHDRDKPGIWVAIQFVPFIGPFWYVIETGFLRGTAGPNAYGPDPLAPIGGSGPLLVPSPGAPIPQAPRASQASQAPPAMVPSGGRPGWVVPVMLALALPGLLAMAGSAAMAWHSHSWLATATVIPARIVGLEPVSSTDPAKTTSYRAVVAATTPDGAAVRVVDRWAVTPPPLIGDAREIAYDGRGPDHAVIVDFWDLYGWQSLVGGLAAVFVVPWLAATCLLAALWRRHRPSPPAIS